MKLPLFAQHAPARIKKLKLLAKVIVSKNLSCYKVQGWVTSFIDFFKKGDVLGSYFYGYILTQAVGPRLATRIGYKRVWTVAMSMASIITLATPSLAWASYEWLFAGRILLGFCHGVTFPVGWKIIQPKVHRKCLKKVDWAKYQNTLSSKSI